LQARPPAKPARHSPEAQPMADGQGEAAWGMSEQVTIRIMEFWDLNLVYNNKKERPTIHAIIHAII